MELSGDHRSIHQLLRTRRVLHPARTENGRRCIDTPQDSQAKIHRLWGSVSVFRRDAEFLGTSPVSLATLKPVITLSVRHLHSHVLPESKGVQRAAKWRRNIIFGFDADCVGRHCWSIGIEHWLLCGSEKTAAKQRLTIVDTIHRHRDWY